MRTRSFLPAAWPPRLRAGATLLAVLVAIIALGPPLAADPAAIVDPSTAALLPPGAEVAVLTRRDGSTVAGRHARLVGDHWLVDHGGTSVAVPAAAVASVRRVRFWLGTDSLGRDVLARVLSGGRASLAVGSLALIMALLLGVTAGLAAGWSGGVVDALLMRLVDGLLAVPMLFLLILLAALFRPSLTSLVVVLGFSSWMGVARLVRGQVLSLKERDFVLAARAIGAGPVRVAVVHLLPNLATPLAQDAALRLGDLILVEASLSYLGLGVQPPFASWGGMVAQGQEVLPSAWWLTFVPGACVALTVIGAALLADGLQELGRGAGTSDT